MTNKKKSLFFIIILSFLLSSCAVFDSPTEKVVRADFISSAKNFNVPYRNLTVKDVSNGETNYSVSVSAEVMRGDTDEWSNVFGVFDVKKVGDSYIRDDTSEWCLMFSSSC